MCAWPPRKDLHGRRKLVGNTHLYTFYTILHELSLCLAGNMKKGIWVFGFLKKKIYFFNIFRVYYIIVTYNFQQTPNTQIPNYPFQFVLQNSRSIQTEWYEKGRKGFPLEFVTFFSQRFKKWTKTTKLNQYRLAKTW